MKLHNLRSSVVVCSKYLACWKLLGSTIFCDLELGSHTLEFSWRFIIMIALSRGNWNKEARRTSENFRRTETSSYEVRRWTDGRQASVRRCRHGVGPVPRIRPKSHISRLWYCCSFSLSLQLHISWKTVKLSLLFLLLLVVSLY